MTKYWRFIYYFFVKLGYVASENGKAHLVFACHTLVELVLRLNPINMYVDQTFRIVPPNPKLVQLITFHFEIDNCVS